MPLSQGFPGQRGLQVTEGDVVTLCAVYRGRGARPGSWSEQPTSPQRGQSMAAGLGKWLWLGLVPDSLFNRSNGLADPSADGGEAADRPHHVRGGRLSAARWHWEDHKCSRPR